MVNPIRIRTHVGDKASVFTLYIFGKWVSMANWNGKNEGSMDSTNLEEGGRNHLLLSATLSAKVASTKVSVQDGLEPHDLQLDQA